MRLNFCNLCVDIDCKKNIASGMFYIFYYRAGQQTSELAQETCEQIYIPLACVCLLSSI